MATTSLTVYVRPPLDRQPTPENSPGDDDSVFLTSIASGAAHKLSSTRRGAFSGDVPEGHYRISVTLSRGPAASGWQVAARMVRVHGQRQRLQFFLGKPGWVTHRLGYSLIPFQLFEAIAIVFETEPLARRRSDDLLEALVLRFGFDRMSTLDADPERNANLEQVRLRGAVLLVKGNLLATDPAGIEDFVVAFTSRVRSPAATPPRVGIPVDLRAGRLKVLDRRFVLSHREGYREAELLVAAASGKEIHRLGPQGSVRFAFADGDPTAHMAALDPLGGNDDVRYVEPDLMSEIEDADPVYARTVERFPKAWDDLASVGHRYGSAEVTLAILDRQLPYLPALNRVDHPEAPDDQIVDRRDFFASPDDPGSDFHGLKVYGIIGAKAGGPDAVGVAPGVSMVLVERPALCCASYNDLLLWLCGLVSSVAGFQDATSPTGHPADIVCCAHASGVPLSSLFSDATTEIVNHSRMVDGGARGAVLVYAAGNFSSDVATANGFADDINTIAVANWQDAIGDPAGGFEPAVDTNFGSAVNLCALGAESFTLYPGYPGEIRFWNGGTSAACAAVSGAVALLLTKHATDSYDEVVDRLEKGARAIWSSPTYDSKYGHGLLDVGRSLKILEDETMSYDDDTKVQLAAAIYGDYVTRAEAGETDPTTANWGYHPTFEDGTSHNDWINGLLSGTEATARAMLSQVGIDGAEADKVWDNLDQLNTSNSLHVAKAVYNKLREEHMTASGEAGSHDY